MEYTSTQRYTNEKSIEMGIEINHVKNSLGTEVARLTNAAFAEQYVEAGPVVPPVDIPPVIPILDPPFKPFEPFIPADETPVEETPVEETDTTQ